MLNELGPRPTGLTCDGCPALVKKAVVVSKGTYWEEMVTEASCSNESGRAITGRWERSCPPPEWCRPAREKRADELRRQADELVQMGGKP